MFFIEQADKNPRYFFAVIIAVVVSVCFHELAHGVVAVWLGDDTPIEQERITLNPLVHMGPVSLVTLLLAGLAWGAMPVDPSRLRWRFGPALVAAAGPITNALFGVLSLVGLGLWYRFDPTPTAHLSQAALNGRFLLQVFGVINILLAMFNLIPFPPLDGSKILGNFSARYSHFVESIVRYSPVVYLQASVILFMVAGNYLMDIAVPCAMHIVRLAAGPGF